jgi:4-hydroxy-tetrahydrodipicolinate synthase
MTEHSISTARTSTDRLLEHYLECGVSGITILGVMGEAPKLTAEESAHFARHVMARIGGRVPVVVGVTGAGIDSLARLTQASMDAGAAGVMVAPIANLLTEAKVRGYFAQVCQAIGPDVPVAFQDYPQGTGVQVSVETILELTVRHPQIVMLKHEDWPGLGKLSRVRAESGTADVPRLSILTGNAGLFLPMEMQRGADGAMTGFAYPQMMVQVIARHVSGDIDGAEDLFDAYLPLVRYEQQFGVGLAIRKEILHRQGILASARVRAPGPTLTKIDADELTRLTQRLEKRLEEIG